MWRNIKNFIEELEKDDLLKKTFLRIGNMSTIKRKDDEVDFFIGRKQPLCDLLRLKYVIEDESGLELENGTDACIRA